MKARYTKQLIGLVSLISVSIVLYVGSKNFYEEKSTDVAQQKDQVTVIPVTFLCEETTDNKSNLDLVERFNELYKDKYYLDVEWFTGNAAVYRERLKMLNSVNELPAIITDVSFDQTFYELLVNNKQIIDLAPYYSADSEWQGYLTEEVIDSVREENGEIYMMPLNTTYYSGIYWNKELFAKAGITDFPSTWNEFWQVCDQLKSHGIVPLSLHTDGTSWAPMLLATSYLGQSEEGQEFIRKVFPETYDVDVFRETMAIYMKAFEYTTDDAIGANFDVPEKHFYEEKTAMIPNGRWMIENLDTNKYATYGFEDKVSFASFPEGVLIGSPAMSGWAVSAGYSQEVQEGAIAFLKYRNHQDHIDTAKKMDPEIYDAYPQVLKDYFEVVNEPFKLIPNYQLKWNGLVQNDVLSKKTPALLENEISLEEFIKELNQAVERYDKESGSKLTE